MHLLFKYNNKLDDNIYEAGIYIFNITPLNYNDQFLVKKMEKYRLLEGDEVCFLKLEEEQFNNICFFAKSTSSISYTLDAIENNRTRTIPIKILPLFLDKDFNYSLINAILQQDVMFLILSTNKELRKQSMNVSKSFLEDDFNIYVDRKHKVVFWEKVIMPFYMFINDPLEHLIDILYIFGNFFYSKIDVGKYYFFKEKLHEISNC